MSETFPIERQDQTAVMKMTSVLDMSCSGELLTVLRKAVSTSKNLSLDVIDVERVSTPSIQVILAAAKKVEQAGGEFLILNVSSGFERGMRELGLMEYLGKWRKS